MRIVITLPELRCRDDYAGQLFRIIKGVVEIFVRKIGPLGIDTKVEWEDLT